MLSLKRPFHHHHISVMQLGHLLTRSGLAYPEASSQVCHDSFCQLGNSVSLPWVIYYGAFDLHVVSSFFCIPVICPKLLLFLIPLQFMYLLCKRPSRLQYMPLYISWKILDRFRIILKYQISLKSAHWGAQLFHEDRRTDTTKLIDTFRNFANLPKHAINPYPANVEHRASSY
jgi:hypothetical protein